MKKEKLLNKIVKGNFNNNLEKVLSKKDFPIEVKNELLTMFYKIETGYSDYYTIKKDAFDKKDYIENLISIIEKNCEKIVFIGKGEKESQSKNEIKCFPIDINILESLSNIGTKDITIKGIDKDVATAFSNFLKIGNTINITEPLRDFNGFSWNIIEKDIKDLDYNLMYQNLIYLVGNDFVENWVNTKDNKKDYFSDFQEKLNEKYGKTLKDKVMTYFLKLSVWKNSLIDKKYLEKMENKRENLEEAFYELENREMYLVKLSKLKKKKEKEIKNLDKILSDKKLLQNEYTKRNENLPLEKKIFSVRVLKENLIKEREKLLKEINDFNKMMIPKIFLKKKQEIEDNLNHIDIYDDIDLQEEVENNIINLQKEIIKCMCRETELIGEKEQLIQILYKVRYYFLLPVEEEKSIYQVEKLKKDIDKLIKLLTIKALNLKAIIEITDDDIINKNIMEKLLLSKIIKLEDINIKITNEKGNIYLTIYDEETQDSKIKLENIAKNNIKIKLNKKISLFI